MTHLTPLKSEKLRFQLLSTCNWSCFLHSLSSVGSTGPLEHPCCWWVARGCGEAAQLLGKLKLLYLGGDRALGEASQRGCGVSFSGDGKNTPAACPGWPSFSRGLVWMISRGHFQPQPFWGSGWNRSLICLKTLRVSLHKYSWNSLIPCTTKANFPHMLDFTHRAVVYVLSWIFQKSLIHQPCHPTWPCLSL